MLHSGVCCNEGFCECVHNRGVAGSRSGTSNHSSRENSRTNMFECNIFALSSSLSLASCITQCLRQSRPPRPFLSHTRRELCILAGMRKTFTNQRNHKTQKNEVAKATLRQFTQQLPKSAWCALAARCLCPEA